MKEPGFSKRSKIQIVLQGFIVTPLSLLAILLLSAWRWDYWQIWSLTGLSMVLLVANLIMMRKVPGVIDERLDPGKVKYRLMPSIW